jgi:integrase
VVKQVGDSDVSSKKSKQQAGIRARMSYKGVNYEKHVRNKEALKKWRAQMLVDLERCPIEIQSIRNTWVAVLEAPGGEVVKKFPTLDPAMVWLSKAKTEVSLGVYLNESDANMTLEIFVVGWRKSKHRASGRTMQSYNQLLKNQILPFLGQEKLRAITSSSVRSWIGNLVIGGVGAPTIRKSHALLRQVMKSAFEDELIRRNPVVAIELPTVVEKEQRALTMQELISLSKECGEYEAMIIVMGIMGPRIGEVCALQVRDISLLRWEMTIRRGMTHGENYKRVLDTTKTKQVRVIPIPLSIVELLIPLLEGQGPNSPVFRGVKGGPINDGWFRKAVMGPALAKLGWTDISLHNLRHTCASLLISAGTPITAVSRILGHSSVMQTLITYGHYYKDDIAKSMRSLGESFAAERGLDGDAPRELVA